MLDSAAPRYVQPQQFFSLMFRSFMMSRGTGTTRVDVLLSKGIFRLTVRTGFHGVETTDGKHRGDYLQQKHNQGEERTHRDEEVVGGLVAIVASAADTSSVPFGARSANWHSSNTGGPWAMAKNHCRHVTYCTRTFGICQCLYLVIWYFLYFRFTFAFHVCNSKSCTRLVCTNRNVDCRRQ